MESKVGFAVITVALYCLVMNHDEVDRAERQIICCLRNLSVQPGFSYAVRTVNGESFIPMKLDTGNFWQRFHPLDDPTWRILQTA